ncbi:MAG: putative inorganic carbon transporter subunit DabA, partial [Bacteroidota bacterium]|nr:putative inorganic carbon transporter subunit DabA [Bacteroidota bacterium]
KRVRAGLKIKGIDIPDETDFVGGLHDTTLDEVTFFDEFLLSFDKTRMHNENVIAFEKACSTNAKERARRFENIELRKNAKEVHNKVKLRAFSLFQPRPEWDHANNAMCIVGRRIMTKNLFFDRRTFLNSYDYKLDPTGEYLFDILRAVAPVCGGINLEYFFSKLDNQRFGSGSKLPHNVVGLFGVANGADGDLRPGLASQMIEIHDAVRLLLIVEQFPDLLLSTIKKSEAVEQWFLNNWINLIAINPETRQEYYYINGIFTEYNPISQHQSYAKDMEKVIESNKGNIPVHIYSES